MTHAESTNQNTPRGVSVSWQLWLIPISQKSVILTPVFERVATNSQRSPSSGFLRVCSLLYERYVFTCILYVFRVFAALPIIDKYVYSVLFLFCHISISYV